MQRVVVLGVILMLLFGNKSSTVLYQSAGSTEDWQWTKETSDVTGIVGFTQEEWLASIDELAHGIDENLSEVDFSQEIPIFVTLGWQPTGGYQIIIDQVIQDESGLLITVRQQSPGDDDFVIMVMTYPYDFIRVPRQSVKESFTIIDHDGRILD